MLTGKGYYYSSFINLRLTLADNQIPEVNIITVSIIVKTIK